MALRPQTGSLLAFHLSPLLSETHREFNRLRGGPLADADFALEHQPLFYHEYFLQHRNDGYTILGPDLRRGAAHRLIQFDGDNLGFLSLENNTNKLFDGLSVGDDADLAGRHRPFLDRSLLLKEGQLGHPPQGASNRSFRTMAEAYHPAITSALAWIK
jgi:hypothetical protein